jgi:GGDEF domain-containing protein
VNGLTADDVGNDNLTGLCDDAGFLALANEMLLACQQHNAPVALAYFDFEIDDTSRSGTDPGVITSALITMADKLRQFYRATDILGRVGDYRLAALFAQYTDNAVPIVEGAHAITDATDSADNLILTIGMVHATPGGTLDQLMHDADLRIKEIRRRESSTTRHDQHGPAHVPAKHSKRRARNTR